MITRLPASWLNHNGNIKRNSKKRKITPRAVLDRINPQDVAFYSTCGGCDFGVLALDLGIQTGWALGKYGSHHDGSHDYGGGHNGGVRMPYLEGGTHSNQHPDKRKQYTKFHHFLTNMYHTCKKHNLHFLRVYYEKVMHHTGIYAAHTYGGFEALLMAWCDINHMDLIGMVPTEIKKRVTGNGHASKENMMQTSSMLWKDVALDDHNHADALCLLHIALSCEAQKLNELNTKKG